MHQLTFILSHDKVHMTLLCRSWLKNVLAHFSYILYPNRLVREIGMKGLDIVTVDNGVDL